MYIPSHELFYEFVYNFHTITTKPPLFSYKNSTTLCVVNVDNLIFRLYKFYELYDINPHLAMRATVQRYNKFERLSNILT